MSRLSGKSQGSPDERARYNGAPGGLEPDFARAASCQASGPMFRRREKYYIQASDFSNLRGELIKLPSCPRLSCSGFRRFRSGVRDKITLLGDVVIAPPMACGSTRRNSVSLRVLNIALIAVISFFLSNRSHISFPSIWTKFCNTMRWVA